MAARITDYRKGSRGLVTERGSQAQLIAFNQFVMVVGQKSGRHGGSLSGGLKNHTKNSESTSLYAIAHCSIGFAAANLGTGNRSVRSPTVTHASIFVR